MFSLTKDEAARIWPELERLWLEQVKRRVRRTPDGDRAGRGAPEWRPGERPTVLVVDDDDDIRDYATAILQGSGCQVVAASSPSEALHKLGEAPTIDLMFTDIVLPEIDGFKLAELAKRRHPALRVLYTSGYPDRLLGQPIERYGRLLVKPYRSTQLEQAVREATAHRPG